MDKEELTVTNDLVFQQIFGKVGNEEITKGFLERILGIKIKSLTLDTNKRLIGNNIYEKIGRVDVKAKLSDGTKVIIEMQAVPYEYMPERLLYYWARAYTEDLTRGRAYDYLKKTIAILVSEKSLSITEGIEEYHTIWEIREKNNIEMKYTDDLEIHIIELEKYKDGEQDKEKGNWIKFIKDGGNAKMNGNIDKALKEANEELDRLLADPANEEVYFQRIKDLRDFISFTKDFKRKGLEEGIKKGIEEGRKEGIKEGIEEGKKEGREEGIKKGREEGLKEGIEKGKKEALKKYEQVILKMYKSDVKIEDICKFTELTEEEINKIIKENS